MEKDKSRGIKHVKGKVKYKGNSKKDPKHVPPKTVPNLESNWDRYTEENKHEAQLTNSNDFALLANLPISSGGYFRYEIDENAGLNGEESNNDLFCLNLNDLNKCVLSIPMYERLGIDKNYFKENEIKSMEKEAETHLLEFNKTHRVPQTNEDVSDKYVAMNHLNVRTENSNDVLDTLQNCSSQGPEPVQQSVIKSEEVKNEEDLEQWLDDILDD